MNCTFRFCASLLLAVAVLSSVGSCQLTADEKTAVVRCLNFLRSVATPRASNMNAVSWDDTLASLAQNASDRCIFAHNYDGAYANKGEVVYKGQSRDPCYIFNFMFLEREGCNVNTGAYTGTKYPFFNTCGHYQQLVTAGVSKVGCGVTWCTDSNIHFCEFNKGLAYPPYQPGTPGSKCGISYATSYCDRLCTYVAPFDPVPSNCDCRLNCLNYGNLTTYPMCQCKCPTGYTGMQCETKGTYGKMPNDCRAQGVTCQNGGTPTMVGTVCSCVCPTAYSGDKCEVNIEQAANSLYLSIAGKPIYQSYWPMPESTYSGDLRNNISDACVKTFNNYCKANFAQCCPNSNTVVDTIVTSITDLDNKPEQQIDGTLSIAFFVQLSQALTLQCGGTGILPKAVLLAAWPAAEPIVKQILSLSNITLVSTA